MSEPRTELIRQAICDELNCVPTHARSEKKFGSTVCADLADAVERALDGSD